jgi:hypothetical protein
MSLTVEPYSSCFCTFIISADSRDRVCRDDILAEGEELGSNILQVARRRLTAGKHTPERCLEAAFRYSSEL